MVVSRSIGSEKHQTTRPGACIPAPAASQSAKIGRLDNRGNPFTPPPSKRAENRWKLADAARASLHFHGVEASIRACGMASHGTQKVEFRCESVEGGGERIAVDGVRWCGSVRCPRCAPLRASVISERVGQVLESAYSGGFNVAMMTLTVRHDAKTKLADERSVMMDAFRGLQRGGLWRRLKADGLAGLVRVVEVTWGQRTGWHLHIHCLVLSQGDAVAAGQALTGRWLDLVKSSGMDATEAGQDVRLIDRDAGLGDYGTKGLRSWGVALEMAGEWRKTGKRPGRMGVAELLALAAEGDGLASAKYAEAVAALKGMRVMVLGPALKKALGLVFEDPGDEDEIELDRQAGELLGDLAAAVWHEAARKKKRAGVVRLVFELRDVEWCDVERLLWNRIMGREPPWLVALLARGSSP